MINVTVIPTIGLYNKFIAPLTQLGFTTFEEAFIGGIINEAEFRFLLAQFHNFIPTQGHFLKIQEERFQEIER